MYVATLFTLGYERRSLAEFLAILHDAAVDVLVDVRDTPWSHRPEFSQAALTRAAHGAGIAYLHAKFCGNPKVIRAAATRPEDVLRLYVRHLADNGRILEALDELVGRCLDRGKRVCLTCYERDPNACHRGVLAECWRSGLYRRVRHLGAEPWAGTGLRKTAYPRAHAGI